MPLPLSIDDAEQIAFGDCIEEFNHLCIQHFYAAAAKGLANAVFVVGSVDVDVSIVGVAAVAAVMTGLQTSEADDARCDQVLLLLVFRELGKVSGWDASFECHAHRFAVADFVCQGV